MISLKEKRREEKRETHYGLLRRALTMIEDAYFFLEEYKKRSHEDREEVREAMEALKKALRIVDDLAFKELDEFLYTLYT
jgi:hypothetical protein